MRSKPMLSLILLALIFSLFATSCGQKGELYLPADLPDGKDQKSTDASG